MKANLWCCYQRDVPTGCIKNSRVGCVCTRKKCATTTRKIFVFFLGWARPVGRKVSSGWARPV